MQESEPETCRAGCFISRHQAPYGRNQGSESGATPRSRGKSASDCHKSRWSQRRVTGNVKEARKQYLGMIWVDIPIFQHGRASSIVNAAVKEAAGPHAPAPFRTEGATSTMKARQAQSVTYASNLTLSAQALKRIKVPEAAREHSSSLASRARLCQPPRRREPWQAWVRTVLGPSMTCRTS